MISEENEDIYEDDVFILELLLGIFGYFSLIFELIKIL